MRDFWLAFVPMFVAVDPVGLLPVFIALTGSMPEPKRRRVVMQSVITALVVSLGFLALGKLVLRLLGVTVSDFLIAGGVLLFVLALADLLSQGKPERNPLAEDETLGAVPLGVPLIAGPAVFAASLVLIDAHGVALTVAAVTANILLAGVLLWRADAILGRLGNAGSRVVSKLASLILAAVAVMFVRKGMIGVLHGL